MSEKAFSANPVLNDIFADTAARIMEETGTLIEPTLEALPPRQSAEPPPFSVPINDTKDTVEVAPGILVSEHLIRDAVAATVEPATVKQIEQRALAKARDRAELKEMLSASQQVVQSMYDRLRNPPNVKEKYVSYDAMPAALQRVVKAYIDVAEANKELDEAVKALQLAPPQVAAEKT